MAGYYSDISFKCPMCFEEVEQRIDVPETYWSGDNADERSVQDNDAVDCDSCSATFDIEINNNDGQITIRIDGFEKIDVSATDADLYDPEAERIEWIVDFASEPHKELEKTLYEIDRLVRDHGSREVVTTMNRMLFSQQVAAMEAYLCDTLLNLVMNDSDSLTVMLDKDKELKEVKIPLSTINKDPSVVKTMVGEHIQGLLFHNLEKVSAIYRYLSISIFHPVEAKARLFKAMSLRHDCVHRNGRTKEGAELTEITAGFIIQNGKDIRDMADYIEGQL